MSGTPAAGAGGSPDSVTSRSNRFSGLVHRATKVRELSLPRCYPLSKPDLEKYRIEQVMAQVTFIIFLFSVFS
jgi:hypothetical protein